MPRLKDLFFNVLCFQPKAARIYRSLVPVPCLLHPCEGIPAHLPHHRPGAGQTYSFNTPGTASPPCHFSGCQREQNIRDNQISNASTSIQEDHRGPEKFRFGTCPGHIAKEKQGWGPSPGNRICSFNKIIFEQLQCANYFLGAQDINLSKNRHSPCFYRAYGLEFLWTSCWWASCNYENGVGDQRLPFFF